MASHRLRLLRGLIIAAQPLIVLTYFGMALWGTGMARPQGAWLVVLILPALFMGFMLLNAALFVFITREFTGSEVKTKHTVTQQEMRQR